MPEKWVLQQLQGLPLAAKIAKTQLRIREWYEHFNGDVYVAFSGGKDSTVLANIVRGMYPDVPLVFSNTGLEYPEIQSFARSMGAEFVRPRMRFDEVISNYGYPIISKEVAEAIYYARRIRGARNLTTRQCKLLGQLTRCTNVLTLTGRGRLNGLAKQPTKNVERSTATETEMMGGVIRS